MPGDHLRGWQRAATACLICVREPFLSPRCGFARPVLEACAAQAPRVPCGRARRGRGCGRGNRAPRAGPGEQQEATATTALAPPPPDAQPTRLRDVNLACELRRRVFTLQSPQRQVRGALRQALRAGLHGTRARGPRCRLRYGRLETVPASCCCTASAVNHNRSCPRLS